MALKEVCIAAVTTPGMQAGDIIEVRDPKGGIGLKEGRLFIWLLLDEADIPTRRELRDPDGPDKHAYNLPLGQLKALYPIFDLQRATDETDDYQPFFDTDPQTGMHRAANAPLAVRGLVVSKGKGP